MNPHVHPLTADLLDGIFHEKLARTKDVGAALEFMASIDPRLAAPDNDDDEVPA
jgi:uncharacterized protein HemX